MSEHWLYCPDLRADDVRLDDAEVRHALRSLRLGPGDAVTLFDGRGRVGRAVLGGLAEPHPSRARRPGGHATRRGALRLRVEVVEEVAPPARTLTLIVAGCKGPRLEWLIEKATELGVARLLLTDFERSVVRTGPQHSARLRRTALEACKQCRRAYAPHIESGLTVEAALAGAGHVPLLVAHPAADAPSLGAWLAARPRLDALALMVGPEGGFSPAELEWLRAAGGQFVVLAEHVLRVETAAVAAAAVWAGCATISTSF